MKSENKQRFFWKDLKPNEKKKPFGLLGVKSKFSSSESSPEKKKTSVVINCQKKMTYLKQWFQFLEEFFSSQVFDFNLTDDEMKTIFQLNRNYQVIKEITDQWWESLLNY